MGGRNTPLFQAASSLSAHHAEHDSPPSLWCWDELFLLSPQGVKIFCLVLSFLNFISRQRINTVCVGKRYLLWTVHTNIVWFCSGVVWGHVPAQSKRNECFIKVLFSTHILSFTCKFNVNIKNCKSVVQDPKILNSSLFYLLSLSLTPCNYHVIRAV